MRRRAMNARRIAAHAMTCACALFLFAPGSDRIVCERIYFDQTTIARQLLGDHT